MASLFKNITVLLGLAAMAGVGYYLFIAERSSSLSGGLGGVEAAAETEILLRRLADLQNIDLTADIFTDVRFRSLRDFSTLPPATNIGRTEPFERGPGFEIVSPSE